MSDLGSYFNSYAKVAPQWAKFVHEQHAKGRPAFSGFDLDETNIKEDGTPELIEITADNYPQIYRQLHEECDLRDVYAPTCYVDTTGRLSGGQAYPGAYAIAIDDDLQEISSEKELRWLIAHELKHLYQADSDNLDDIKKLEDDADRSGVESVGIDVAKSMLYKMAVVKISNQTGISAKFLDKCLPKSLITGFPFAIDSRETELSKFKIVKDIYHPSFPERLNAMQEHLGTLES